MSRPFNYKSEIGHSPDKVAGLLGSIKSPIHLNGAPRLVSRSDVDCAAKYLRSAVDFYKDDAQRQKATMKPIDEAIGRKGEWGFTLDWADGIKSSRYYRL